MSTLRNTRALSWALPLVVWLGGTTPAQDWFDDFGDGQVFDTWEFICDIGLGGEYDATTGDLIMKPAPGPYAGVAHKEARLEGDVSVRVKGRLVGRGMWYFWVHRPWCGSGYVAGMVSPTNGVDFVGIRRPELFEDVPFDIDRDRDYLMQLDVVGDTLELRVWPEGEEMPEEPQVEVIDETFRNGSVGIAVYSEEGAHVIYRYVWITDDGPLTGDAPGDDGREDCPPAFEASRTLWDTRARAEGGEVVVFEEEREYEVTIEISRHAGEEPAGCTPPQEVTVVDTVPAGWKVDTDSIIPPGTAEVENATVTWRLDLVQHDPPVALAYTVTSAGAGEGNSARFQGSVQAPNRIGQTIQGEDVAWSPAALASISDFGTIQHWLILGPFTHDCSSELEANPCDAPGEELILLDYLTDGEVEELDIEPREGDVAEPDFGGAAASTGLATNWVGRNPDDVPTWTAWRDLDDEDDRIDFESVYGYTHEVMCYAVSYLDVLDDVTVNFGVSSDDSIQVVLDGKTRHVNNIARGALERQYQDTTAAYACPGFQEPDRCLGPIDLEEGRHTLLVKVFEGGGEHNFRVGFTDEFGQPLSPDDLEDIRAAIEISLEPVGPPVPVHFRRGDSNGDGEINITDASCSLNWLFAGAAKPSCLAALNTNGDEKVDIADAVALLTFLFAGGAAPVEPFPDCGPGMLPADQTLGCVTPPQNCAAVP